MPALMSYVSYVAQSKARDEIVNNVTFEIASQKMKIQGILDYIANIEKLITDFNKKNKKIYYKLDRADIRDGYVTLSGWALSLYHDEQVNLYFTDSNGEDVKAKFVEIDRKDVVNALSPNNKN